MWSLTQTNSDGLPDAFTLLFICNPHDLNPPDPTHSCRPSLLSYHHLATTSTSHTRIWKTIVKMVAISGTYDVMLLPLLLPISQVLNFLPPKVRDITPSPLISFTHDQIVSLGLNASEYNAGLNHPVMLELGYQNHTGPGPRLFRPSFDEAKLDVLGMRHPSLSGKQPTSADKGFVFKQIILFSNFIMSTSSSVIAGLRSNCVTITPHKSPSIFAVDEEKIQYNVKDFVEVNFVKDGEQGSGTTNGAVGWAGKPWYGWATGDTLTQFVFDVENAKIQPVPYKADVRMRTASFYDPSKAAEAGEVSPEWSEFDGVASWRFEGSYSSKDMKAADAN